MNYNREVEKLSRADRIINEQTRAFSLNKSSMEQSRGYCEALVDGEMTVERQIAEYEAKQKEISEMHEMTKEEAHNLMLKLATEFEGKQIDQLLSILEALGLIKFKEPEPKIVKLYEETTMMNGTIRLETWPEGLVLWVGGRIAWKNFS